MNNYELVVNSEIINHQLLPFILVILVVTIIIVITIILINKEIGGKNEKNK